MKSKIVLKDLLPAVQQELDQCEYGQVSLTLTVSDKQIVRWNITRSYTSQLVRVPGERGPEDNV